MIKDLATHILKWFMPIAIVAIFTAIMTTKDLGARVGKLESQRNVEARLLCKIALRLDAIDPTKDQKLSNACTEMIGL